MGSGKMAPPQYRLRLQPIEPESSDDDCAHISLSPSRDRDSPTQSHRASGGVPEWAMESENAAAATRAAALCY